MLYFKELMIIIRKRGSLRKEILQERLEQADKDNNTLRKELERTKQEVVIYKTKLLRYKTTVENGKEKYITQYNNLKGKFDSLRSRNQILVGDLKNDLKNVENLVRIMRNSSPEQVINYCDDVLANIDKILKELSKF
ncbi:hypothetical protein [Dapis sp. BLCC M229]|uniref:hypothetical protein n=1 Tax=Dapis sp. BLCC M229 TaxID=3400188 RepID=UPI003CEB5E9D